MRSTERLITLLASVNGTAIDNDGGTPGEHIETLCHEAAERMKALAVELSRERDASTAQSSGYLASDHH